MAHMTSVIKEKERNTSLDLIRSIAIFLVVLNHAFEHTYGYELEYINSVSLHVKIFAFAGYTLGRIGVPLFLMLTGYLLLTRKYDLQGIKSFYKKNLLPLLLTWEIWVLIYHILSCIHHHTGFQLKLYLREALFLKRVDIPHAWYVPVILGIYLFIPLLAKALEALDWKILLILAAVMFAFWFVAPSANLLKLMEGASEQTQFLPQLNLYFSGGSYSLYLMAGYGARKRKDLIQQLLKKRIICLVVIAVCIVLFAFTVTAQIFLYNKEYAYTVWYTFFTMPIIGAFVFCLLMQIRPGKILGSIVISIAQCAFGIYLIHELCIIPAVDLFGHLLDNSTEVIVLSIGAFLISYGIVKVVSLIPFCGKILFLKKASNIETK